MKKNILTLVLVTVLVLVTSCNRSPKAENEVVTTEITNENAKIEVIQFHSEHRCMTCNKIEALTLETLKTYPELEFKLVNVDDTKNEKLAESFEATGTALFLYNPKTGNKKDLTDFAFMTAGDEAKFEADLKAEIELFLKS